MSKNKMWVYGGLFVIGIVLVLIGLLVGNEEKKSIPTNSQSNIPATEDNPLDGDSIGELPSRGIVTSDITDIYKIEESTDESGKEMQSLEHELLRYRLFIPKEDLEQMTVEETERGNIISTAFYYQGEDVKAYVFSINNYPYSIWTELQKSVADTILSSTDMRVITYSVASDNPFEPASPDSDAFLTLMEKVPAYTEQYNFVEKETE